MKMALFCGEEGEEKRKKERKGKKTEAGGVLWRERERGREEEKRKEDEKGKKMALFYDG